MGNAGEFPGQTSGRTRVLPSYGQASSAGTGRIRYAHGCAAAAGELGIAWSAEFPVAGKRNDLWVLVCGGIATAAAFAAAFVASGGVASHPAAPSAVPAAVSRDCPSPTPGTTP